MREEPIDLPAEPLAELCRRHGVRRLSLFGSAATGKLGPESDLDFLVEFEPDRRVDFFDLAEVEAELAELLRTNRRIDLRTPDELSRFFRDEVVAGARVQFAA